jgi:hypothetical protein
MHVRPKLLPDLIPQPQLPRRNVVAEPITSLDFVEQAVALAEDLGVGGKRANRLRGAKQIAPRHHPNAGEAGTDIGAANDAEAGRRMQTADSSFSELTELIKASAGGSPGSERTQSDAPAAPAAELSFDELLARAAAAKRD